MKKKKSISHSRTNSNDIGSGIQNSINTQYSSNNGKGNNMAATSMMNQFLMGSNAVAA